MIVIFQDGIKRSKRGRDGSAARALAVLIEDLSMIPSTYKEAKNYPVLGSPMPSSGLCEDQASVGCTDDHAGATYLHIILKKNKQIVGPFHFCHLVRRPNSTYHRCKFTFRNTAEQFCMCMWGGVCLWVCGIRRN